MIPCCSVCGSEFQDAVGVDREFGLVLKTNPLRCRDCGCSTRFADPVVWAAA